MIATLLRRFNPLPWLVLLLVLLAGTRPALASHLLGGEMTYKYLDANGLAATPYRYEVTLTIYTNCNSTVQAPSPATINIYNQTTGARISALSVARTYISPTCITVAVPPGCTNTGATQQPYKINRYVTTVSLPAITGGGGYYAYFTSGNRNAGIANISLPDYEYLTLYATLAPPALANRSPVFAADALAVLCAADTTVVLNNAVDADGDRLEYSFATPYSASGYPSTFALPLTTVAYNTNYSNIRPLGATPNSARINASSGISKFYATSVGAQYVVAIDVKEYRTISGVETLIGTTRRDVQLIVGTCPATAPPTLPAASLIPRSYTIQAGSTLSIPLTGNQPAGHPLTLTATSVLLDGSGGYNASFAGNTGTATYLGSPVGSYTVTGTTGGTVAGTFVFSPTCTQARATPYDVTLLLQDIGCAGKITSEVLRITVVNPTGPTAIAGNLAVCGLNTAQTYTASGGTAPTVQWTVTGGTIVGSATANPVTVNWPTAGTGTITAQGVSQYGCLVDFVTKNVTISPAAMLTLAGTQSICQGGSTTITVTGGTAPYTVTGGAAPLSGAGPFVLSPSQNTTYTITSTAGSGCAATGQVAITVNPLPVATAGTAVSICPGGTAQLGAAAVAGITYNWSPTTGLSNATAANPTVTLPNATGAPITQTYTLTATNPASGCQASSTVVVTVAPPPVAPTGAAVAICAGGTGQLGAAPVAGYTYSWSPTTGLSSSTVANPNVTLTNTTGTPVTQAYTLTVTSATGCTGTGTVAVTVNPAPVAAAGAAVAFCSGGTGQLGAAPVAGYTYSWSPTAGLSSSTVANPTVTLGNTTSTAITQTYTLTVTNAVGCVTTASVAVTVNPLPTANAGAAVTICSGGSALLGAVPMNSLTYSWSPATGLSSTSAANPTVTLTNTTGAPIAQTYTLTVTSGTGCTSTGTVIVTVNPLPTALPGAAVAFCSGGSGQLGAAPISGLTYSWSPATGLSSASAANPTITLTNTTGASITQIYTLTVSSGTCTSTGTVAVTVNPALTANAGAAKAICSGGSAQLGAAPVAGYTYSWSPTTGLSSATVANPTVTLTNTTGAPVNQAYTLTVTSATGCSGTGTVAVTVNPAPVAAAGAAVAFCSGGTGQLGAAAVAGYTYSWSPTAGLSSSMVANPTVTSGNTTSAPTTQTYTLTVTSAAGCTNTSTVAVTVNPLPVANAGTAVAICAGVTGQLGAAAVSGLTYSWSPATGLSNATAANPAVTLPNATGAPITQTYTLTVTSANCTSTATVAVTVNPLPVASAGAAVTFCAGGTGQLGAAAVAGYTYSWSPTTGLSSASAADPAVTLPNATGAPITQNYTLAVTNAGGCVNTATVTVTVSPVPIAATGAAITSCSGSAGQLGTAAVAGNTYSWSPNIGLSSATVANPTVTLINSTTANTTQTYTLTVTNAGGCTATGTVLVTVLPAVTPGTIGADQTVCAGSVPAPLASTAAAGGGTGTYAYQWESSPDNLTWTAIGGVTSLTYTPGPVSATTYFRRRATTGTCGAVYSNVVTVTAQPLLIPAVALPVQPAQCAGLPFTFTPAPTNAGNLPTYQWFVNGAAVSTGPTYTSATLADGDIVRVVLTPTVGFCASGPAIATVRVSLMPVLITSVVISTATALPVCPGAPVVFGLNTASNVGTSPQYQWQVDGTNVAGATSPTFTSTTLRDGQAVTLVVRSTNACGQPATATSNAARVRINQPVQISAGPDKTITEGESVVLEGTADGTYPVTWSNSQTLTFVSGNQLRPVAAPTTTTTYTLSAGAGFCGSRSTVTVTVMPRLRIPNAFSPNGDNNDDTWQIDNIEAYPNSRVLVFNRWGAKIFEAANYTRGSEWHGTINGQPAPFGTYYYVITLGNGKSFTGPLTVIN